jgi:hypothetical protein
VSNSWLPIFFRMLQQGVSAGNGAREIFQNLCVINFNYDRGFEHFLCRALQSLLQVDETQAQELMKTLKVFHCRRPTSMARREGGDVRRGLWRPGWRGQEIRTFNEKIAEGAERPAAYSDSSARARE